MVPSDKISHIASFWVKISMVLGLSKKIQCYGIWISWFSPKWDEVFLIFFKMGCCLLEFLDFLWNGMKFSWENPLFWTLNFWVMIKKIKKTVYVSNSPQFSWPFLLDYDFSSGQHFTESGRRNQWNNTQKFHILQLLSIVPCGFSMDYHLFILIVLLW